MISTASTIALIRLLSGGTPAAKVQKATVENLAALLESSWIGENAVTGTAYAATVPSGSLPWATVASVGGKTIVWNQLASVNSIAVATSDTSAKYISSFNIVVTHTYLLTWEQDTTLTSNTRNTFQLSNNSKSVWQNSSTNANLSAGRYSWLITSSDISTLADGTCGIYYWGNTPDVDYNITNICLHDLTLMFGAGNEPSTVADFEAMFPAEYYAYNAGELKSAAVTQMVTADSNATQIGTYAIPAAIQALPGYGWSAGTAYNYIDYDRKVYVQNVGSVDLGTQIYIYNASYGFLFDGRSLGIKNISTNTDIANILCAKYTTASYNAVAGGSTDMSIGYGTGIYCLISNSSYTTAATFKTAMSGVMLYYELATPVETDISAYLTDADALINVEAGGSVTFENALGDDYRIPVPSTVTYAENLIPDVPSSDGTYTLTATVSDGDVTYSWA